MYFSEVRELYGKTVFDCFFRKVYAYTECRGRTEIPFYPNSALWMDESIVNAYMSEVVGSIGIGEDTEYKVTCLPCSKQLLIARSSITFLMAVSLGVKCDYCKGDIH